MASAKSSSLPVLPATSSPVPTPSARAKFSDPLESQPGHLTVIHPAGFTPHAHADSGRKKPLFARVTYRPH